MRLRPNGCRSFGGLSGAGRPARGRSSGATVGPPPVALWRSVMDLFHDVKEKDEDEEEEEEEDDEDESSAG